MGYYERKLNPDGTPNPYYKPRNPSWKKQPSGKSGKSGKGGKHRPMFERGIFVGLDGEGADLVIDGAEKHAYIMLANSLGMSVSNLESGLSTIACLDFILETARAEPLGIFCVYGASYDFNFWLRDIPKEKIEEMKQADGKYYVAWEGYNIRFIQRKFFSVEKDGVKVQVWDVLGFFQGAFVGAIKTWLPGYEKLDLIIEGKSRRSSFNPAEMDFIRRYTDAELEALCLMMNKLRDGIRDLGLTVKGWHGAGAIASAMLSKHEAKKHIADLPDAVYQAAKYAYFGGRIEIGMFGHHEGDVYHYDINSAYPAQQQHLPSLANGRWVNRGKGFDPRETDSVLVISLVRWNMANVSFFPFPYRSARQRKVLFPSHGLNYIWKPELSAALNVREKLEREYWQIDILESWEFVPNNKYQKPFDFIPQYYATRQEILSESKRTGIPNGAEKAIKLGINSLYGKLAQRVGYDEEKKRPPPYFSLAYAGHITSATRAQLWEAAMLAEKPGLVPAEHKIICLATDGIYSTVPLDLDCPKEKVLGKWEGQKHDAMTLVQSGFYFIRDGEKLASFSRGFDKMSEPGDIKEMHTKIMDAWKARKWEMHIPCTRFITLSSALCGGDWWSRWLSWYKFVDEKKGVEGRRLALTPAGTKRVAMKETLANRAMIPTEPQINFEDDMTMGLQHDIPWDEDDETGDMVATEIMLEHSDSYI